MSCIDELDYEILLSNSSIKECADYIKKNFKEIYYVRQGYKQKITDKMIKSAEERVTCVLEHSGAGKEEVYEALVDAFTEGKEYEFGTWSEAEIKRARELAEGKYRSDEWMYFR
jgi:lipoate-protein ligase A